VCRTTKEAQKFVVLLQAAMLVFVLASTACERRDDVNALSSDASPPDNKNLYPVVVHTKSGVGTLASTMKDPLGRPVGMACNVCHSPSLDNSIVAAKDPDSDDNTPFHQQVHDVKEKHGDLTCRQCHNHGKMSQAATHLADQSPVEYPVVVYLCGQCHGPQFRDYTNGTHGGASGYWDLNKGARQRNHCINCHNPHAPAYPMVTPVAPPRDRNLPPATEAHSNKERSEEWK
jgi:hypothetical protein